MNIILPDSQNKTRVGFLGGGQLSQQALLTAYKKSVQIVLFADKKNSPSSLLINPNTGKPFIKDENIVITPKYSDCNVANWTDEKSLDTFLEKVGTGNPITLEWENIPWRTVRYLEDNGATVYPNSRVLRTIQDRVTEKQKINSLGLETVPYSLVNNINEINVFIDQNGGIKSGFILKSRKDGYDGHGQAVIKSKDDIETAFSSLQKSIEDGGIIIEKNIDLDCEVSIQFSRNENGGITNLEPIYNVHENGILRTSFIPAPLDPDLEKRLIQAGNKLISNWTDYKGILTIEFFISKNGEIYVNEIAPRTHNSGHATLDNGGTSQNELWIDSLSGVTTNIIESTRGVVMKNILNPELLAYYEKFQKLGMLDKGIEKFYNYLKIGSSDIKPISRGPDMFNLPPGINPRKLGHVNYSTDEITRMIEDVRSGKKSIEEFLYNYAGVS